jgi:hypothetical protein
MPEAPEAVHLLDQTGQPFGSVRRCCNYCGVMLGFGPSPRWVPCEAHLLMLPDGFTLCPHAPSKEYLRSKHGLEVVELVQES